MRLRPELVGHHEQLHAARRPPVADGLVGREHERAVGVAARREPLVEIRSLDDGEGNRPALRVAHRALELVLVARRTHDPALHESDARLEVGADDEAEPKNSTEATTSPTAMNNKYRSAAIRRSAPDAQHAPQVAAQDRFLVGVGEERRLDDEVDRVGPEIRVVRAVDDLA